MKTKLNMKLFGSFSLSNNTVTLGEEVIHSTKLTRILVFFLMNRDCVLSHQRLIELFLENKSKSPEGALKNLMYRLRNVMKTLGDEQYICTLPGAYRWNPDIEVETDYELFERMNRKLRGMRGNSEEKRALCRQILDCYQGNVSAVVIDEPWILPKTAWYQTMYMDTSKILCRLYEQGREWNDLEMLCNRVLAVDGLDEDIHCSLLRSLHKQKKYDLAILHYEKTNKTFYENMGVGISEKVRRVFHEMMQDTGDTISDMESLLKEAREPGEPEGAFFCDYQTFRQIYRMEVRRLPRVGLAEYLMLLTVYRGSSVKRNPVVDSSMQKGMEILEDLLRTSLRVGDVVSRYSQTQFIVMLPTCSYESGTAVAERIRKGFQKNIGAKKLKLKYELTELAPTE